MQFGFNSYVDVFVDLIGKIQIKIVCKDQRVVIDGEIFDCDFCFRNCDCSFDVVDKGSIGMVCNIGLEFYICFKIVFQVVFEGE